MADSLIGSMGGEQGNTDASSSSQGSTNNSGQAQGQSTGEPNGQTQTQGQAQGQGEGDGERSLLNSFNNNGEGQNNTDPNANNGEANQNKAPDAPIEYQAFNIPEGVVITEELSKEFVGLAQELKLSQEGAQKLVDFKAKVYDYSKQESIEQFRKITQENRVKAEAEFGTGEEKLRNQQAVGRLMNVCGDKDFFQMLDNYGVGDHPAFARFAIKLGKMMSEDSFREGRTMQKPKSDGQLFYPDMK